MLEATITSLDKDKFHILGIEAGMVNLEAFSSMVEAISEEAHKCCPDIQLLILPFSITSVGSRPLTDLELQGLKESIEVFTQNENTRSKDTPTD